MAFRRGFKTEANSIATEIRAEIGLQALEALDPWGLARHLAIPVIPLSELARDATGAAYLLYTEPEALSWRVISRMNSRMASCCILRHPLSITGDAASGIKISKMKRSGWPVPC